MLTAKSDVWSFGAASEGQLGRNYRLHIDDELLEKAGNVPKLKDQKPEEPTKKPKKKKDTERYGARPGLITALRGGPRVTCIACGPTCSFAIKENGHMFSWGTSQDGLLGLVEHQSLNRSVSQVRLITSSILIFAL